MNLKDKSGIQHRLSFGKRLDDVSVLADDRASGRNHATAIRISGDADNVLRSNHRANGGRDRGLLRVFGAHRALR
ncbi:hypothetical protein BN2475_710075 [Paraburkholderia ribeironis]|uniref:Uncharacterized protein n=1 Tax=Paraburkholderia ribeironis TaxID=1247936 RepID=A0A1N7SIB2_9BURK|nr:hypothetical protein BN2475_710075 [Paraburkholderia ribeironis]